MDTDELSHAQRAEIYMRLQALERGFDRLDVTLVERGDSTERRLTGMEEGLKEHREASKEEHKEVNKRLEELAVSIRATRLSAKDIVLATLPLSVPILGLIVVLLTGHGT